jgi:hypothetical protein
MKQHLKHTLVHHSACLGLILLSALTWTTASAAEFETLFSNQGSVANTRHNLSQSSIVTSGAMITARNNYGEVCVYCHTPHGANDTAAVQKLPLWNRTFRANTYATYDQLGTSSLSGPVTQPGLNSIACLSCHDGTVAIDSIINMPGAGRASQTAKTNHDEAHLDGNWANNAVYPGTTVSNTHMAIGTSSPGSPAVGCMSCHSGPGGIEVATDFTVFAISTDLRNDHPVGIAFPATAGPSVDFNLPATTRGSVKFFDLNGNGRPDTREVRVYDSGDGFEVECASCHDPHGVPSAGAGSSFIPTFLRVANNGSALCLTCHTK